MARRTAACLATAWLLLTGAAGDGRSVTVRLDQTANLGAVRVTPKQVIEDSRCPKNQSCAEPGRLRIRAHVDSPQGSHSRELVTGKTERIAGGQLTLDGARPQPSLGGAIAAADYRFTLRFQSAT
jgi:hypothetical protein